MDGLQAWWHLAGFVAPALWVPLGVEAVSHALGRPAAGPGFWRKRLLANMLACLAVLTAGLWLLGQDGRMWTYTALVCTSAAVACWRAPLKRRG